MEYIVSVLVGVAVGFFPGWLVRHKLLERKLKQTVKQMDELKALQLNLEHDYSEARQKLLEKSKDQILDSKAPENYNSEIQKIHNQYNNVLHRYEQLKHENEELQDQISYFETEKTSWNEYREKTQKEFELVTKNNRELENTVAELVRRIEESDSKNNENYIHQKNLWDDKDSYKQRDAKDTTSIGEPVEQQQIFETDKVNKRVNSDPGHIGSMQESQTDDSRPSLLNKKETGKVTSKRKKSKTVRVERSSSDIIDSFKKDLGIQD